jgi:hypothetical protein
MYNPFLDYTHGSGHFMTLFEEQNMTVITMHISRDAA